MTKKPEYTGQSINWAYRNKFTDVQWQGTLVRTTAPIRNGWTLIPQGAQVEIHRKSPGGFTITAPKCPACNISPSVSRVDPQCLAILSEPEKVAIALGAVTPAPASDEVLAELEALHARAGAILWKVEVDVNDDCFIYDAAHDLVATMPWVNSDGSQQDADLIVALRNAAPALLARVRQAEASAPRWAPEAEERQRPHIRTRKGLCPNSDYISGWEVFPVVWTGAYWQHASFEQRVEKDVRLVLVEAELPALPAAPTVKGGQQDA